jgi:putative hydrolase of the HAD superfamily
VEIGINDKDLAQEINSRYLDILGSKTILIPYAIELLELCVEKNLPVTLITNGFTQVQMQKVKNSNLEHYFSHIVLSDTAGALKPEPAFFKYALDLNNARPGEVLVIGDNYDADILGAINSGIDALFFNTAGRKVELPERVVEIKSLQEAIEFLNA